MRRAASDVSSIPLVYSQHCFWFVASMLKDTANNQCPILIEGNLDVDRLEWALNVLIERHSSLRMAIGDWMPVQRLQSVGHFDLPVQSVLGYSKTERDTQLAAISQSMAVPFELLKPPHLRAHLIQLEPEKYIFIFCFPHIIADGGACHLFEQQLWQLYQQMETPHGFSKTEPVQQIGHWVRQERQRNTASMLKKDRQFWQSHLKDAPLACFPLKMINRNQLIDHEINMLVPEMSINALEVLAKESRMSFQMVLVSTLANVVHELTGQLRFSLISVLEGRDQPGSETLMAPQLKAMPVPFDFSQKPVFSLLLQQTRANILSAYEHINSAWSTPVGVLARYRWKKSPFLLVKLIEWLSRGYAFIARKGAIYPEFLADFLFMEPKPPRWFWQRDDFSRAKAVSDPIININMLQAAFKSDISCSSEADLKISRFSEKDLVAEHDDGAHWESDSINIYVTRSSQQSLKLQVICSCFNQQGMDLFIQTIEKHLERLAIDHYRGSESYASA
ncbi:MAG: hypothetical protein CENE_03174 [Candidatus Celerinatantimonas neptuna]|nr:MAG: hypothetical protein CENE_03174 [Candidatus Celerinatantimonas neptuna]